MFFALSAPAVVAVALLMMLLWELGEYLSGVRESWTNILLDIIVGLLGVALALAIAARLNAGTSRAAFIVSFAVALAGGVIGGIDYRRRAKTSKGPATER